MIDIIYDLWKFGSHTVWGRLVLALSALNSMSARMWTRCWRVRNRVWCCNEFFVCVCVFGKCVVLSLTHNSGLWFDLPYRHYAWIIIGSITILWFCVVRVSSRKTYSPLGACKHTQSQCTRRLAGRTLQMYLHTHSHNYESLAHHSSEYRHYFNSMDTRRTWLIKQSLMHYALCGFVLPICTIYSVITIQSGHDKVIACMQNTHTCTSQAAPYKYPFVSR